MHLYTLRYAQVVELLHGLGVVVGAGLPYSWSVSQDQTLLNVYLTDDPLVSDVTTTPVDLAPVIPDTPLPPPDPFSMLSIDPATMALDDLDTTLIVHGTAFRDTTVILFDGEVVPTTFVSAEELNTVVSPSMAPGGPAVPTAGVVPVQVQQDALIVPDPSTITFEFTTPVGGLAVPSQPSAPEPEPAEVGGF